MPEAPRHLSATEPALAGVRVADLGGPIGAYTTKILADLGADVVVVEPPGGGRLRSTAPFRDGADAPESSLAQAYYDAGKRGITLDVTRPQASDLLDAIGEWADVVVLSPSRRQPVQGFDLESLELSWARADAVVCSITPFGLTGPYRNRRTTHFVSVAMSGMMHRVGPPEGPPVALPSRILWESAGTRAAMDVLAALWAVPRVGGQLVDVSVHAMAASKDDMIDRYDVGMLSWGRLAGIGLPPTGTWQCRDGFFDVACYQDSHWDSFLDMLDHPPELAEPALADMVLRQQIFDGLVPIMAELMADRSREDLMRRGQAAGLPCGLLNTPAEFVHDEQVRAREIFQPLTKPGVGTVELPGPGFRTDPPLHRQAGPAPTLGQHTEEFVVGELGCKPEALTEWKESGVV